MRPLLIVLLLSLAGGSASATTKFASVSVYGINAPVTVTSAYASDSALTAATVYANQSVVAANGQVTIPAGVSLVIVTTAPTVVEGAGRLILKLAPGATFASAPTATLYSNPTAGGSAETVAITTLGIATLTPDQNGAVFFLGAGKTPTIPTPANVTFAGTRSYIQLGAFTINAAAALTTAGSALTMTAAASGFVKNAMQLNDATPALATIAVSADGVTTVVGQGPGDTIAIASGAIATEFNSHDAAQGSSAQTALASVGDLGNVEFTLNSAAQNQSGAAAYAPATAGTIVLTGNFQNYQSAYLSPNGFCSSSTPPSGAISGTLAPNSLTFAGLGSTGVTQAICVIASGQSILSPTGPIGVAFTIDGVTQAIGAISPGFVYGGSAFNLPLVSGASASSQGYLRLVNSSPQPATFYAVAHGDGGGSYSGAITTLAARNSVLITQDTALAAIGAGAVTANGGSGNVVVLTTAPALGSPIQGVSSGNASGVSATAVVFDTAGNIFNQN